MRAKGLKLHTLNQVVINNGVGDVTQKSYIAISAPKKDTSYTLTATSYFGVINKASIDIKVDKTPPNIKHFSTSSQFIPDKNSPATLSWQVKDAETIELDNGLGEVTSLNKIEVLPKKDTRYTLRATSYFGAVSSRTLYINVSKEAPKIHSFNAVPSMITHQKEVELNWHVEGAESLFINNGVGDVTGKSSYKFHFKENRIYTLFAESYFGVQTKASVTVQALALPPIIEYFNSSSNFIEDDTPIELKWKVKGAEKVWLEPQIGTVPSRGKKKVSVNTDTSFILTAKSELGVMIKKKLKVYTSKLPPLIQYFRCRDIFIEKGKSTKLEWKVTNAKDVRIDNGIGLVSTSGQISITPQHDTTYTLIAKSYFDYERRVYLFVRIIEPPILKTRTPENITTLPTLKRPKQ